MFNLMESISATRSFLHAPLSFVESMHTRHGTCFSTYLGPNKFHFFSDPDAAEHILINNVKNYQKSRVIFDKIIPITGKNGLVQLEGEQWLTLRKQTSPLFSRDAFARYPAIIAHYLRQLRQELDRAAQQKTPVDLHALFVSYAIKSATRMFLGIDSDTLAEQIARDFVTLNQLCGERMRAIIPAPLWIKSKANREIVHLQQNIKRTISTVLRSKAFIDPQSLLGILLESLPLKDEQSFQFICDQLMTFLFAGFETTAASLTFCFYLLARHPQVQTSIREEALRNANPITLDTIKSHPLAAASYREALRLYPPAWILARVAQLDDKIGAQDIKKGDNVIVCIQQIHRHHDLWSEPHTYFPERFLSNQPTHTAWRSKKCAFIPFGAGARICSGHQLAMLEAISALATLTPHFKFSSFDNNLELNAMVTLCPKGSVFATVTHYE